MDEKELNFENELRKHISLVQGVLLAVVQELLDRAKLHDQSKFDPIERDTFMEYGAKLKTMQFGSEEYKKCLAEMGPALEHHYKNNRHHPEFHKDGVSEMTLVDLVEMYADWIAAGKRMKDGGNFPKAVEHNGKRFQMSEQLQRIFLNSQEKK